MRKILLAEEQNISVDDDQPNEINEFSRIDQETMYKTFLQINVNDFDKEPADKSECNDFVFEDETHMHSFRCSMSVDEFYNNFRKITPSHQLKELNYVKSKFEDKQLPFHLFITGGGAGVGKTFSTKIIIAYLQLFCANLLCSSPVIVCAPTGTAANNTNV